MVAMANVHISSNGTYFLGDIDNTNFTSATVDPNLNNVTIEIFPGVASYKVTAATGSIVSVVSNIDTTAAYQLNTNGGSIVFNSTVLTPGLLSDVSATINDGGSFTIGANLVSQDVLNGATVTFGTGGGTNVLGTAGTYTTVDLLDALAPYKGFINSSDVIDDQSLNFADFSSYTVAGSGNLQTVIVTDSNGTDFVFQTKGSALASGTFDSATGGSLRLTADASGGTEITLCFVAGTRIATPDGERAIETLQAGDEVLTADGRVAPVRWIGIKEVRNIDTPVRLLRMTPVRIRAGALAENVPSRDLLVSPDHAVLVDGVLVQAGALVNRSTILRETRMPAHFTYYHVELEDHALILAEGTPAETFIDNSDRMAFDNWEEHRALFGDAETMAELAFPRAKSARQVPNRVHAVLAERAAQPRQDEALRAAG
jgi:Hint domain